MSYTEHALSFTCNDATLYGIVSVPQVPASRGVLIAVGGPQYRVGSHRQFVLLARGLAAAGVPVMRFDYRGMGDSEGEAAAFDSVADDMRAAIDRFFVELPLLEDIVVWGLCDAASAALFYAPTDVRVSGLVLLNPWIRTDGGQARARLRHYYPTRLRDRELWQKILRGRIDYIASLRSFLHVLKDLLGSSAAPTGAAGAGSLPDRMRAQFGRFEGKVLLIMSGRDLTAAEFLDTVAASRDWQQVLASPNVMRHDLVAADHTFSRREWRDQVTAWSRSWLQSW